MLGVNQLIGHGWPCSPPSADGLGWFFYASGALDDRNAWWPAAPGLMRYLQRLSWLLRQGEPVRDVLLYLPTTDAYARLGTATTLDLFKASTGLIDRALTVSLRAGGYDFAVLDDDATALVEPAAGLTVLLPGQVSVPADTRRWFEAVTAAGGRVLTVTPEDDAATLVGSALAPDLALDPVAGDVAGVHRRIGDVDAHLLVNTGPHTRTQRVLPRTQRRWVEVWDPSDGRVVTASNDPVEVTLLPYQALLLVQHDQTPAEVEVSTYGGDRRRLTTDWRLIGPDGTDLGPVTLPHRWEDDPRIGPDFSGTQSYVTTLVVAERGPVRLDLGTGVPVATDGSGREGGMEGHSYRVRLVPPVGEVVRVLVDDRPVAVLWAPPYSCDLTGQLRGQRTATLRLEVSNTSANALAADPTVAGWVADAERRHGRRFRMQALDRVRDGLSSGLFTVPEIVG